MSTRILGVLMFGLGFLALAARADEVLAGLWELSMDVSIEAVPGFKPGALSVNQCLAKEDVRDPARVLAPVTSTGASDCVYSEKSYVGDTFRFKMQCGGELHLQTVGEVVFTPSSMSGSMTTSSTIDGNRVEFRSVLSGHRVGDC